MKCLCGYSQMPNNIAILQHHIQDCMVSGALKGIVPDPVVIWRDGEFHVVKEASETEQVIETTIVRPRPHVEAVEKKVAAQATALKAFEDAVDTPEEFEAILEEVAETGEIPEHPDVQAEAEAEAEAVEEAPKPKPKKRAPAKKKAAES